MNAYSIVRMEGTFCLLARLLDGVNVDYKSSKVSLT